MFEWMPLPGVLSRSMAAVPLILAALGVRLLLTKAPKRVRIWIWALVAVRLMAPVLPESPMSLVPFQMAEPVYQDMIPAETAVPDNITGQEDITVHYHTEQPEIQMRSFDWTWPWLAGMALMLGYALVSWWRLRRRILSAVRLEGNVYQSEFAEKPFVLGIVKPRIYLPFGMESEARDYVLAHERCHIRQRDHWWKPIGYGLLCVYWFHPLVWLSYILFCRDLELACDEQVIRDMDDGQRTGYSQTLLQLSRGKRVPAPCPLTFGEGNLRSRVKNILNYRKPSFWLLVLAVAVLLVLGLCFLTDPVHTPTLQVSDMTVVSGKNSVPLLIYPENTPIRYIKDAVPYLTIDPTWEEFVPFRIYRGEEAVGGFYNAFDTVKFEPIGHTVPSGLEPQTYLFQNADVHQKYLVVASIEEKTYCFGVQFDADWVYIPGIGQMEAFSEEQITELLAGIHRDRLIKAWGEPEDELSGFWGEIFPVPDSDTAIIVYYDRTGTVERVKVDQRKWLHIPDLKELDSLSERQLIERLSDIHRDKLITAWGEPDDTLSGFWGDVFFIPDSYTVIITYYDQDGFVEMVKTDQRNG